MSNLEKIASSKQLATAELAIGIGSIDPETRMKSGDLDRTELNMLIRRLATDEYYGNIDGQQLVPNAAGGSFSLVIADALTTSRFRQRLESADQHAINVYHFLQTAVNEPLAVNVLPKACVDGRLPTSREPNNSNIGGHDADHHSDHDCGCGAEDKLGQILSYISTSGSDIRQFLKFHGVDIDDHTHSLIVDKTQAILNQEYVSTGQNLKEAFVVVAGRQSIETLHGSHNEVALAINSQTNKTLDRNLLQQQFGSRLMVFNFDMSAFKKAVNVISLTESEATQKFIAGLYFNVATTAVLAGPSLRVVVR